MTYQRAISYLSGLDESRIKPGLDRIKATLDALGAPHQQFSHVLVSGTNGKGSVVQFMGAALKACGIRAGLYTSPHLHRFEERIVVDGRPAAPRTIGSLVEAVRGVGIDLTYFEFVTAMALEAFRQGDVDIGILEVGLGGRWDATNATAPVASVITTIGVDHQSWLGHTVEEIAAEKGGIARRGRDVIIGHVREPALGSLLRVVSATGARPVRLGTDFRFEAVTHPGAYRFRGRKWLIDGVSPGLEGQFQADNAACAMAALESLSGLGFNLPAAGIRKGIGRARWPGRYQKLVIPQPTLVDSAHNQPAMEALVTELIKDNIDPVWLFSALADKDVRAMVTTAMNRPGPMVVVPIPHPRAVPAGELGSMIGKMGVETETADTVGAGLRRAWELAGADRTVVVAGSVFLAAAVLDAVGMGAGGQAG